MKTGRKLRKFFQYVGDVFVDMVIYVFVILLTGLVIFGLVTDCQGTSGVYIFCGG